MTLDPDETWAHPQHWGRARIVESLLDKRGFDTPGRRRPALYGIREHGWYERSLLLQPGDIQFDRTASSQVLQKTYAEYWKEATPSCISQSSHPDWCVARVSVGILPGYDAVDMIRRLGATIERPALDMLLSTRWVTAAAVHPSRRPRRICLVCGVPSSGRCHLPRGA